ncbi:MAG: DUF4115 domain-containing protein [Peptococcaceae bacterium]|jgi:transcriptional regulator with XRE-family HTH domain|nr:DUF4115 domain-containing protein [Peptococcaceae bacterium]
MAGIGDNLREAREKKKISLEQVESAIKIKKRYLIALETEAWDRLPERAYAKGFLRAYARYLGLPEQPLANMFELSFQVEPPAQPSRERRVGEGRLVKTPRKKEVDLRNKPRTKTILILCVLSVALLYLAQWTYKNYFLPESQTGENGSGITLPLPDLPEPDPEPEPPAEPPPPPPVAIDLNVTAVEDCWLLIMDGEQEIYTGTLRAGEVGEWPAIGHLIIRLGNPAGARVTLNGHELSAFGDRGQPLTKAFSIEDGVLTDDDTGEILS